MHPITTVHYLALRAALLLIGTVGVLTRRNIVIVLMSIELILNAVNINLIAFSLVAGVPTIRVRPTAAATRSASQPSSSRVMIPTPGAVGGFHDVCQFGLAALLKIDPSSTVAPVIGLHAVLYIPPAALGALCFLWAANSREGSPT